MTTVQITLPDELARDTAEAGLLEPQAFANLLRKQLRAKAAGNLVTLHEKAATDEDFSPEAMAEEVRAMRAGRRPIQKAS